MQPAQAQSDALLPLKPGPSIEIGAGAVFVSAHPQLRLGWWVPNLFQEWGHAEAQILYALGENNFAHQSHTLGLQVRYLAALPWLQDWQQFPYLRLGLQTSLTAEAEARSPFASTLGLGFEGRIWGPLRYSSGIELIMPDIYSRAPFVFRPELNFRWIF